MSYVIEHYSQDPVEFQAQLGEHDRLCLKSLELAETLGWSVVIEHVRDDDWLWIRIPGYVMPYTEPGWPLECYGAWRCLPAGDIRNRLLAGRMIWGDLRKKLLVAAGYNTSYYDELALRLVVECNQVAPGMLKTARYRFNG